MENASNTSAVKAATAAADRFFREYSRHCQAPSEDTLFGFFNAAHSLNDKIKSSSGKSLLDFDEFHAVKAFRNFYHHQDELQYSIKVIARDGMPSLICELMHVCLIHRDSVEASIAGIQERYREESAERIRRTLNWYGDFVDINPCIFNLAVEAFELVQECEMHMCSDAYFDFCDSYAMEEAAGLKHKVAGIISCHASDMDEVLAAVFAREIRKDGD